MSLVETDGLTDDDIRVLNDFSGYLEFMPTKVFHWLINCPCKIIVLFCVGADEYIYTLNGVKKAGDLVKGDILDAPDNIVTHNHIAEDDLYEVTFSTGVKLKCNGKHLLYWRKFNNAKAEEGFKCVDELINGIGWNGKLGYVKFNDCSIGDFGERLVAPKMLGYLCSDGYITNLDKQSIKFTNNDMLFVDEVDDYAKQYFGINGKRTAKGKAVDLHLTGKAGQPNKLMDYIRSLKISKDSFGSIVCADESSLKKFISGYFNGDGYLLLRRRKNGWSKLPSVEVGFCIGKSHERAVEFQYILWKLGIHSWIVGEYMGKCVDKFYRVKVNAHHARKILPLLDTSKYPDKFKEAFECLGKNPFQRKKHDSWVAIRSIKKIGMGKIAVLSTSSGEFLSYCGMRNHNTGNQFGKNETCIMDYYLRIWGKHPQKHKNILPDDKIRTIRFASENLPGESDGEEVKNTQYPVLKRRFNANWILKDITARKTIVQVQPQTMRILANGEKCMTKPVNFEFVSYGQTAQSQAGVQRKSVYIDESAPKTFFDEQIPRLLAADGDLILSYTPVPGNIGWEFDELYERARVIYRTEAVRKRIKDRTGEEIPEIQTTNSTDDIAVIMAATDDNPIYKKLAKEKSERLGREISVDDYITEMLGLISDEDVIDARRYGLFRQLSGKIFKPFNEGIHKISTEKYFPEGIPHEWKHFRGIDWHESTPWACGWIAVSPHDEIFAYNEFNPSPEKMITMEICRVLATRSQDYKFDLNLIDPLSSKTQTNTGLSSLDDINRIMAEFRRQGIGTGGHWQVWDTKSQKGRDEIRKRLQNAVLCGVPFNNEVKKDGITKRLPTLWICDNCVQTVLSLKNWRREEWGDRSALMSKDEKETPQQRWSHFCTMLEGLMKRPEVFSAKFHMKQEYREPKRYFQGAA